jgi:MFS-type transporter involved in bile tolerance (Atg22 family)
MASTDSIGLCIMTIGSGYTASIRSYLATLVPKHEVAFLFTIVAIFEGIGALVATPALAEALSLGIKWGGYATGLPFFIVALLWLLSGIITWTLPLRSDDRETNARGEHEPLMNDE